MRSQGKIVAATMTALGLWTQLALAGLAPDDPRWSIVAAFEAKKKAAREAEAQKIEAGKIAEAEKIAERIEKTKPALDEDGIPLCIWQLKNGLKDPDSMKIGRWRYFYDHAISAWFVEAMINAKNSYGGYVGFKRYVGAVDAASGRWDYRNED